jgi:hypothetical protein
LFNFDRTECEIMAQDLLASLQKAEKEWRLSSPEWKWKMDRYEEWKRTSKERQRQAEKANKQKKDANDLRITESHSWESDFDPLDPSPQFSFAGERCSYTKSDLDSDLEDLRWARSPRWATEGLRRGIAVHHAGMNKAYRSLVERCGTSAACDASYIMTPSSLFRVGFVRVVIATGSHFGILFPLHLLTNASGTLALGINAPTKTAVFCGDSPYLTALMASTVHRP